VIPLASQLPPLESSLRKAIPSLINSFKVLAYVTNEVAYNAGGKNPGFLYWLAWFAHNADSFISNSDANGPVWRALLLSTCPSLKAFAFGPLVETLLGTKFGCT
jgi:phospholipid/cholesterol/gamma-HCH transport system substrate-binding protein